MNVMVVHERYVQVGGEDRVYENEVGLLRSRGHTVETLELDHNSIDGASRLRLAVDCIWNHRVYRKIRQRVRERRPAVVHFHNTFPLVSPAAYYAARREGAAVVQTLHNYRLLCLNATLYRAGNVCQQCVGRHTPWLGVVQACYRASRLASASVGLMLVLHRLAATWRRQVDRYIALTESARRIFVSGGLPAHKILVKPNTAAETGPSVLLRGPKSSRRGALFVGRLTPEKGIMSLLDVWRALEYPIDIVGDGPLRREVQGHGNSFIRVLGALPHDQVLHTMREAEFLVVPSEWYEPFGMVIVEAFSQGLPVVVPALGGFLEIVVDGKTGLHFNPGDRRDLEAKVRWAIANPGEMCRMGEEAGKRHENFYTAEANYRRLISIYREAIDDYQSRREGRT